MRVELAGGSRRRLLLLPPQCFGERSALTGDPVSANVVAQRNTRTWVLSVPVLFEAMAQEVAFFRNVATLLGLRLRGRTRRAPAPWPRVVLAPTGEEGTPILLAALARGQHYAPGSEHDELRDMTALARKLYGDATFAQLRLPVAVVAADLTMGTRTVLDSGPVARAARATAAIPGVFAPVRLGDSVLVDGAVVSRLYASAVCPGAPARVVVALPSRRTPSGAYAGFRDACSTRNVTALSATALTVPDGPPDKPMASTSCATGRKGWERRNPAAARQRAAAGAGW